MTVTARQTVCFGPFELDTQSGELFKSGYRIKLQGQPIQILRILLEQPGKLVTREEINQRLWPSDTFVDFEHSLNTAVKKLRNALGDEAETPRYIETLPRRGYRFIGEITAPAPQDSTGTVAATAEPAAVVPELGPLAKPGHRTLLRPLRPYLIALAVIVVIITATFAYLSQRKARTVHIESIAVLPLTNLSGDQQQDYFADGITEELIADLAQIKALRVISRTSVMRYKGTKKSLPEIGHELNVDAVLEGSVQRSGDRVRITAQLIRASSDTHVWAQTYERDLKDVLALRDELARAIASEIRIELTPNEKVRLTRAPRVVPEAYEAYLKGRHFADRSTPEGLTKAIEYFDQAVAKDPKYALAWAALGHAYFLHSFILELPLNDRCIPAMKKAMELDENLAEAHVDFADLIFHRDWMWREGQDEFRRAVELDPGSVDAQQHYAIALWQVGRYTDAIRQMRRTRDLDPLSTGINLSLASLLRDAGQIGEAEKQFQKTIELDPTYSAGYIGLGALYEDTGRSDLAIENYRKFVALDQDHADRIPALQAALDAGGPHGFWKKNLEFALADSKREHVASMTLAALYVRAGENENAIRLLQRTYEQRSPRLTWLNAQSAWEPLRSDPRFQEILRLMQFPQREQTPALR